MGTSTLMDFNDANFDAEVLKSTVPVLVDFTATWCGPCQQLKPIVEELAKDFAGKIKMGKLDIDNSKSVPVKYGIMAVPTIILFKDGKDVQKITGLKPKADLRKRLEALVGTSAKV
jgi:thioredoxin 1